MQEWGLPIAGGPWEALKGTVLAMLKFQRLLTLLAGCRALELSGQARTGDRRVGQR